MPTITIEYRWKNNALIVTSKLTNFRIAVLGEESKARAALFLNLTDVTETPKCTEITERVWDNFLRGAY